MGCPVLLHRVPLGNSKVVASCAEEFTQFTEVSSAPGGLDSIYVNAAVPGFPKNQIGRKIDNLVVLTAA